MNNLDDLFHQKLYGAEVPPPPAVWPLVERELRRRRRRMLGWWFFAGAAVLGMAAYWSLWRMPQQPDLAAAKAPLPLGSGPSSPEAAHRLEAPALAGAAAAPATAAPHKGLRLEAAEPTRAVAQGGSAVVLSAATQRAQALAKPEETISAAPLPASAEAAGERPSADPAPAAAQAEAPSAAAQPTEEAALAIRQLPLLPAIGYAELAEPVAGHIARIPLAAARIRKKPNKHQHCYDFSAHPNVLLLDAYAGPSLARKELRTTTPEDSWYRQRRLSTERRD
ncbi:MAG TPA: hypothetical protein PK971_04680, partial [Saprospiraceae bacterium]|nr:hypothetical protein [Saprospiraceae bacterium]